MANLTLEIVEGPDAPRSVLVGGELQIGRDPELDVSLRDRQVSRRHARLRTTDDGAVIDDLGSANGTFVNDRRVVGPTRLNVGDELLLGVSVIRLRSAAQVAAAPLAAPPIPPALAVPERRPSYVKGIGAAEACALVDPALGALVDARTKAQARLAPLAVSLLVLVVVLTYLATR